MRAAAKVEPMEAVEIRGNKSTGELLQEAGWFLLHSAIPVLVMALVIGGFSLLHPDPDAASPKLLCTLAVFLVPMMGGFAAGRLRRDTVASHVWISGMMTFGIVCVYVLGLPTGAGLCDGCGATEKLWRTFFSINRNSGLLAGDGILIGTWIPLSMIGYAVGATVGKAVE